MRSIRQHRSAFVALWSFRTRNQLVFGRDVSNLAWPLQHHLVHPRVMIARPEIHHLPCLQLPEQLLVRSIFQVTHKQMQVGRIFIARALRRPSRGHRKQPMQFLYGLLGFFASLHQKPMKLLMNKCRQEQLIVMEMSGVQSQNWVAVRNGLLIDAHGLCEDPLGDVVTSQQSLQLLSVVCASLLLPCFSVISTLL